MSGPPLFQISHSVGKGPESQGSTVSLLYCRPGGGPTVRLDHDAHHLSGTHKDTRRKGVEGPNQTSREELSDPGTQDLARP